MERLQIERLQMERLQKVHKMSCTLYAKLVCHMHIVSTIKKDNFYLKYI